MSKTGYVIARNRAADQFFTSTSAYDRPKWTAVSEATVYHTAELAHNAAVKLARNGAYECRLVPLSEALPASPGAITATAAAPGEDFVPTDDVAAEPDGGMVADEQTDTCGECKHDPCTCDSSEADIDDIVDQALKGATSEDDVDANIGDEIVDADELGVQPEDDLLPKLGESIDSTVKPITYKDPVSTGESDPLTYSGANAHEDKVKVPANLMSDITKAIAAHKSTADHANARDDATGSMSLTVVDVLQQLKTLFDEGTTESIKRAQILVTSLMSPVAQHVPESVKKFIHYGGRAPTLKDMFNLKQDEKRAAVTEAENHMGDRVQYTYSGWKAACKRVYPGCTFRGDKDIGAAVLDGKDVGEWDGAEGCVFKKQTAKVNEAMRVRTPRQQKISQLKSEISQVANEIDKLAPSDKKKREELFAKFNALRKEMWEMRDNDDDGITESTRSSRQRQITQLKADISIVAKEIGQLDKSDKAKRDELYAKFDEMRKKMWELKDGDD